MGEEIPMLLNDYNKVNYIFIKFKTNLQIKNDLDYNIQETQIINEEINNEKYNVEIIRNDLTALKSELNITFDVISNLKHAILRQKKENEFLKKNIVKKVKK